MERPHGLACKYLKHKNHGPLSVAAAIRKGDIERDFGSSTEMLHQLAACASRVVSVRRIPHVLGLTQHPWLKALGKKAQTSAWVSVLCKILYRCDDLSQFEGFAAARSANFIDKRKRAKAAARDAEPRPRRALTWNAVLGHAAMEHFRWVADMGCVFSLPWLARQQGPQQRPTLKTLQDTLQQPRLQPRASKQSSMEPDVSPEDVTMCEPPAAEQGAPAERIYFRVVRKRPSAQRTQRALNMNADQLAISLLPRTLINAGADGGPAVFLDTDTPDPAHVQLISFEGCDVDWLRENLHAHREIHKVQYTMPALELQSEDKAEHERLTSVLDKFMVAGALPGTSGHLCVEESSDDAAVVQALEACCYVEEVLPEQSGWRLTQRGLKEIRMCSRLALGKRALALRDAPREETTTFEQLLRLECAGWKWQPVPSSYTARHQLRYEIGSDAELVMYSGVAPSWEYLQCLLEGEQIREKFPVITAIPHCQGKAVYAKLLEGIAWQPRRRKKALRMVSDVQAARTRALADAGSDSGGGCADSAEEEDEHGKDMDDEEAAEDWAVELEEGHPQRLEDALEELLLAEEMAAAEAEDLGFQAGVEALAQPTPATPLPERPSLVNTSAPGTPQPGSPVAADGADDLADAGDEGAMARLRSGTTIPWHCFKFIWKPAGKHGAIQATCLFHKGTSTAPACRKSRAIKTQDGTADALLWLKAWCVVGQTLDRKYKHLAYDPDGDPECDRDPILLERAAGYFIAPDRDAIVPDHILDDVEGGPGQPGKRRRRGKLGSGRASCSTAALARRGQGSCLAEGEQAALGSTPGTFAVDESSSSSSPRSGSSSSSSSSSSSGSASD